MVNQKDLSLVGGALCLDFANTVSDYTGTPLRDRISSYDALVDWCTHANIVASDHGAELKRAADREEEVAKAVFAEAKRLRRAIYRVFAHVADGRPADESDLVVLNEALQKAAAHRVLHRVSLDAKDATAHGVAWGWEPEDDLRRPLWPIVDSAAALLTEADYNRIKMCGGRDCTWLFLDESRNRSRKWCDMKTCGNRAKARRFQQRQDQSDDDS